MVDSIGVRDGELDPMAVAVMEEIDIDLSGHRPKRLDDLSDTNFDAIVTLSPEAHDRALDMTRNEAVEVVFWEINDPSVVDGNRDVRPGRLSRCKRYAEGVDRRFVQRDC